ncbi:MAG: carboxypeptidase-like regulatory domain-containing protein [Bacteroidetes bacterium]|nr:carboxypeptidase-like regulatory domain-containing protein [Bacteroidota bacterium]
MNRFLCAFLVGLLSVCTAYAQFGTLQGRITDESTGEGIPFANIILVKNGDQRAGASTDFDGNYTIKPINPGTYDVKISYVGYNPAIIQGVLVESDKIAKLNPKLSPKSEVLEEVVVTTYKIPLIKADETSSSHTLTKDDIEAMPTRNVNSMIAFSAGVYQSDDGANVNIMGSRDNSNTVYIDGIKVRGSTRIPQSSIEQMTTITGGKPANYGDVTGGVINITTKGPSSKISYGVEFETSQFLDAFGYNMISPYVTGPIIKKNKGTVDQKTVLGFYVATDFFRINDADPSANGMWKVKDDILDSLEQNPLRFDNSGTSLVRSAEFVTLNDLEKIKAKQNVTDYRSNIVGKLDFKPNDNMMVNSKTLSSD